MLINCRLLFVLLSLITAFNSFADNNNYFISDNLITYLRAGPGDNFRISGSVTSGEAVTVLDNNAEARYAQVRTENGRIGWIPLNDIKKVPSFRIRLPELESQVNQLTEELESTKTNWDQSTKDLRNSVSGSKETILRLEQENSQLKESLAKTSTTITEMKEKLDENRLDITLKWLTYGGGVAGGGLLLGLILPHIIPSRRKRRDRW